MNPRFTRWWRWCNYHDGAAAAAGVVVVVLMDRLLLVSYPNSISFGFGVLFLMRALLFIVLFPFF